MSKDRIPEGQKCGLCEELATTYCPFCMDEYDTGPKIPVSFYCDKHYESVVERGHCCYEAEQVYGIYGSVT
jgi:hypothetical protein